MASLFGTQSSVPTLNGLSNVDANSVSIGSIVISEDGTITGVTSVDTTTITATTGNITTLNSTDLNFTGYIIGSPGLMTLSASGSASFNFVYNNTFYQAGISGGVQIRDSGGVNRTVLLVDTLGSTVLNSSLTSVGTLASGLNIATGQTYKINAVAVLSATTLGSSVVNSSLTSIGTLLLGLNIATGQTYKINSVDVLSATTLGSSIVNSSLTSVGTLAGGLNIATGQTYKINAVDVLSSTALGSNIVTAYLTDILPSGNQINFGSSAGKYVQIGTTNTFIDFVSFVGNDYSARIQCSGGSATNGTGTLTYTATGGGHIFNGDGSFSTQLYTPYIYADQLQISVNNLTFANTVSQKIQWGVLANTFLSADKLLIDSTTATGIQVGSGGNVTQIAGNSYTSNTSDANYVFSASSVNADAYKGIGTTNLNWSSTAGTYTAGTGAYAGAVSTTVADPSAGTSTAVLGEYMQIQFNQQVLVGTIYWTAGTILGATKKFIRSFQLVGSNTGTGTWELLLSFTGGTDHTVRPPYKSNIVSPYNRRQFSYYRFIFTLLSTTGSDTFVTISNYFLLAYQPLAITVGNSSTVSTDKELNVNGDAIVNGRLIVTEECIGTTTITNGYQYENNVKSIFKQACQYENTLTTTTTTDGAFFSTRTGAVSNAKPFLGLNQDMTNGNKIQLGLGKASTTNQTGEVFYQYSSTATDNKVGFQMYGNTDLMFVDQNGLAVVKGDFQIGNAGAGYGVYNPTLDKQLLEGYPCSYWTPANNRTNRYGHYRWTRGGSSSFVNVTTTTYDIPFSGYYTDALVPVGSGNQENCSGIWKLYITKKSPSANGQSIFIYSFSKITGVTGFGSLSLIHSNSRGWGTTPTIGAGTGDNIRVTFGGGDLSGGYVYMTWTTEGCI